MKSIVTKFLRNILMIYILDSKCNYFPSLMIQNCKYSSIFCKFPIYQLRDWYLQQQNEKKSSENEVIKRSKTQFRNNNKRKKSTVITLFYFLNKFQFSRVLCLFIFLFVYLFLSFFSFLCCRCRKVEKSPPTIFSQMTLHHKLFSD